MTETKSIFRFKFSKEFSDELFNFSKMHQHDERNVYKQEWDRWVNNNSFIIEEETKKLKENGFKGDVFDKMYKSSRYYFRKKKAEKVDPKKRRKYVSIDSDIIENMDNYIKQNINFYHVKPSISYEQFCMDYSNELDQEENRLIDYGLESNYINKKFKKTYKNRYFIINKMKKNGNNNLNENTSEEISEEISENTSEEISENTSEEISEEISEGE